VGASLTDTCSHLGSRFAFRADDAVADGVTVGVTELVRVRDWEGVRVGEGVTGDGEPLALGGAPTLGL
jgi:hypothetical protein